MATPTGITRGAIIKAQDIYNRYHTIIDDLLSAAHSNIASLQKQIKDFKDDIPINTPASDEFEFLQTSSYNELSAKTIEISASLTKLEKQWYGNDNENSAHGGIQDYDPINGRYKTHAERIKNPLHVIMNNRTNNYAADGRVNQSDFIGAYHFQSVVESLYSIASRLRDIYIAIDRNGTDIEIKFGEDNPWFHDLKLIENNPDYISSDFIDNQER